MIKLSQIRRASETLKLSGINSGKELIDAMEAGHIINEALPLILDAFDMLPESVRMAVSDSLRNCGIEVDS